MLKLLGPWLYPVFVLRAALYATAEPSNRIVADAARHVHDSRVGAAAVLFYAHLGITRVHAGVASAHARRKAERLGMTLTADRWVSALPCKTEELLREVNLPHEAVTILEQRLSDEFLADPQSLVTVDGGDPAIVHTAHALLANPLARVPERPA